MKELGLYYSDSIKTLIVGYRGEYGNLIGRVIGNTFLEPTFAPFSSGYTYEDWHENFIYVGRFSTYFELKPYMDFLHGSNTEQIEAYMKVRDLVKRHCDTVITKKKIEGRTFKIRSKKCFQNT